MSFVGSVQATLLMDGGFETPLIGQKNYVIMDQSQLTGWKTTAADHKIELWSSGYAGVTSFEGNQFAEINANMKATLYQDLAPVTAGEKLNFQLAHRGRLGVEAMQFTITDLGADGLFGTGDDTTLFSKTYADGTGGWGYYNSYMESPTFTLGNAMRFSFASLVPGSYGNFLDGVAVSIGSMPLSVAPEPGTWAAMSLLCFATFGRATLRRLGLRNSAS